MLIQIFQSDDAVYHVEGESLQWIGGILFDGSTYYIPYFSYLMGTWGVFVWLFSAAGGFIGTKNFNGGLTDKLYMSGACRSRLGQLYIVNYWGGVGTLQHFNTSIYGVDRDGDISAGSLGFFTFPGVDEVQDRIIDQVYGEGKTLGVWTLSTREKLYEITMPEDVIATSLQDENRIWILLASGVLVLFDYVHRSVLGAVRVPQVTGSGTKLAYDFILNRPIFMAQTPDDGSNCTDSLKGFRSIPVPTRLMTPVPVQVPRKGGTAQIMASLLGDMNEPVGGALITATVTGPDGKLVGIPFTDGYGRGFVKVECDERGDVPIACSATLPDYIQG